MLFNRIKNFIYNGKGIGFRVVIPATLIITLIYSIFIANIFVKEFQSPEIQEILTTLTSKDASKIEQLKKDIIQTEINRNRLPFEVIKRALFVLSTQGRFDSLSQQEISGLLIKSFYVQSIFMALFLTGLAFLFFVALYFITTQLGALFIKGQTPALIGRVLSFYFVGFVAIYTINVHFFLNLSFIFMMLIVILSTLLTVSRLKKSA